MTEEKHAHALARAEMVAYVRRSQGGADAVKAKRGVIRFHEPAGHDDAKPEELVLVLHGFGGNADAMAGVTRMNCKADEEGFFVAYLNGTACDPNWDVYGDDPGCTGTQRAWNHGLTPSLGVHNTDDVQFVRDVPAFLEELWRIDERRVYVAGLSNGGMMAHFLATQLPDRLAGAAVVAGLIGRDPEGDGTYLTIPDSVGSIPMLIMHGTLDESIAYDGLTTNGEVTLLCPCKSVDEAVAYWLEQNPCRGPARSETVGNVITTAYAGCYANNEVVLVTHLGGTHQWLPGATDTVWGFLSRHSLTAD